MIDRDRLNNADPHRVALLAVQNLDRLSADESPEVQVLALSAMFLALCKRYRADPSDTFRIVSNILGSKHKDNADLVTMNLYMEHEYA